MNELGLSKWPDLLIGKLFFCQNVSLLSNYHFTASEIEMFLPGSGMLRMR